MKGYDGERRYPRLDVNKSGVLENLDSGGLDQVTLINFSGDGMCIESDRPYSKATKVRLTIELWPNEKGHKSYDGEVVWCHAVKRKKSRRYEMGVKIKASDKGH